MNNRKFVVIVPDGAADLHRAGGLSPLDRAFTPYMDYVAREGRCGLMQTLYQELPKGSLVAHLGMLGWDPRIYYPGGRASAELLAHPNTTLEEGDLAFRANLARFDGGRLTSYSANGIGNDEARLLVDRVQEGLKPRFSEVDLYHRRDFRTLLVVRGANLSPSQISCREPHESHGLAFELGRLVSATDRSGRVFADRINDYLRAVATLLRGQRANALLPWGAATRLSIPSLADNTGFRERAAIVGAMDFLEGLALAGRVEFHRVGTGRPDTDYGAKGAAAIDLLRGGCSLVFVHINAPDEAAHMGDVDLKIHCLERVDAAIVRPIVEFFRERPSALGGLMVVPDHYTNVEHYPSPRHAVHSTHPVPFAVWSGCRGDQVTRFTEDACAVGSYSHPVRNHLELLDLLRATGSPTRNATGEPFSRKFPEG